MNNLECMLQSIQCQLPKNIRHDIEFTLRRHTYVNKHVAFIIDERTREIISYDFNVYYKSKSFPFSVHAEVQTIGKYYKAKSFSRSKKILMVAKLSRTGIVGNSRCCLNCMRFVRNNFDNLNLKKIYYSSAGNQLIELGRDDLIDADFHLSKGYSMGR